MLRRIQEGGYGSDANMFAESYIALLPSFKVLGALLVDNSTLNHCSSTFKSTPIANGCDGRDIDVEVFTESYTALLPSFKALGALLVDNSTLKHCSSHYRDTPLIPKIQARS